MKGYKICPDCMKTKNRDSFSSNKTRSDGLSGVCKECDSERGSQRYQRKRSEILDKQKQRRDNDPQKEKDRQQKYREENSSKIKVYQQSYWKTPAGRAVQKRNKSRRRATMGIESNLTALEWEYILFTWDYKCAYCGVEFSDKVKPTQDHIIPLSKGGTHTKRNITCACQQCNDRKGTKIVEPGNPVP